MVEIAIIPMPPTSIKLSNMNCPAKLSSCPTDITASPFTQEAEVAIKSASENVNPKFELKGIKSKIVPIEIKTRNPATG